MEKRQEIIRGFADLDTTIEEMKMLTNILNNSDGEADYTNFLISLITERIDKITEQSITLFELFKQAGMAQQQPH